jgi:hypothetical protein
MQFRSAVAEKSDNESSEDSSFDAPLAAYNEKMRTTNMLFVRAKPCEVRDVILTEIQNVKNNLNLSLDS